jgi:Domain of unknown function (DUF222)
MTDLADPPTEVPDVPMHPVTAFAASLAAALDGLAGVSGWSMTPDEQRQALVDLRRQRARLEELELRVLVAADRNDVGAESGATSTAAWLADATGSTRAQCFRDVHLAHALDEEFESTRAALGAGDIDVARAAVVVSSVRALTDEHDDLPPGTQTAAEAHLLAQARRFDVVRLRRLGRRVFEVVCPEGADAEEGRLLAAEEEYARRLAYLTFRDNGDGTVDGRFRLPTLHADLLKRALDALTSPRRLGNGHLDASTGVRRSASTLRGQGLMELLERHLDLTTMPGQGGSPFTVVVTVGLDALQSGLGTAAVDTGARISAGEVRRLACRAGIIPMVLDGESVPLDLGRERRLFSKHQRIALAQQYGGCAASNCDRPPAWTEVHHLDPWAAGGRTDLSRGLPLCPAHHRMADHTQRWDMRRMPDGGVRFSRRT